MAGKRAGTLSNWVLGKCIERSDAEHQGITQDCVLPNSNHLGAP